MFIFPSFLNKISNKKHESKYNVIKFLILTNDSTNIKLLKILEIYYIIRFYLILEISELDIIV